MKTYLSIKIFFFEEKKKWIWDVNLHACKDFYKAVNYYVRRRNMNEDCHLTKPKSKTESYKTQRQRKHMYAYVSTEQRLILESVVLKEKRERQRCGMKGLVDARA